MVLKELRINYCISPLMVRCLIFIFFYLLLVSAALSAPLRTLSLDETIQLAIRENPNVQRSQLSHVMEKFALEVEQWQFHPHFSLNAEKNTNQTYSVDNNGMVTENKTGINAGMSWNSPMGSQVKLTSANNISEHYNPGLSLSIMQPLMRGFGKPIVEASLYNAIDSEKISRLTVEETLRSTVTNVINAYLDVISAESTLEVDQQSLERSRKVVTQTKLFIKAGHKAGVELVTVQADEASSETRIESDKNRLDQARYALLTGIGIDPNTPVHFATLNIPALIKKYHIPDLKESKELILANDIQYQVDQITLQGTTQRSVQIAEDNTRWQLNLEANAATGNGSGGGEDAGINSIVNGVNRNDNVTLSLSIPIDDRAAKLAVSNAKIAVYEAHVALQQEKWNKETNVINGWNSIYSAERSLQFAENAQQLQKKSYQISFQKYTYGLIDSIELQTATQQLVSSEQGLILARINYLKALVNMDMLIGNTLKTWDVQVKYDSDIPNAL
jgi:outer membrane protein TolC